MKQILPATRSSNTMDEATIQKIVHKTDEITRNIHIFTMAYVIIGVAVLGFGVLLAKLIDPAFAITVSGLLLLAGWVSMGFTRRYTKRAAEWHTYWLSVLDKMETLGHSLTHDEWKQFSSRFMQEFEKSILTYKL